MSATFRINLHISGSKKAACPVEVYKYSNWNSNYDCLSSLERECLKADCHALNPKGTYKIWSPHPTGPRFRELHGELWPKIAEAYTTASDWYIEEEDENDIPTDPSAQIVAQLSSIAFNLETLAGEMNSTNTLLRELVDQKTNGVH